MTTELTIHGGLDVGEIRSLGLQPEDVLDFSANINPLGPSENVLRAAGNADLSSYPDRHSLALREAIAVHCETAAERILVGNGSTELIHLLARARLRKESTCLIFGPTFGEYAFAARQAGAQVHFVTAQSARSFVLHLPEALEAIERLRPSMVFLCNPNNPTGVYLGKDFVSEISNAVSVSNGLLVLDDAYVPLTDGQWDSLTLSGNGHMAILRSMTKDHAIAGVRLGYMVAPSGLVDEVRRLQPAWSVNSVAQAVGIAALQDDAHVAEAREIIKEAKAYLRRELAELGISTSESSANFIIAYVGDAVSVRGALLRYGIAVRDCTSFGLPEYVRIAVRKPMECSRLVTAMRTVLNCD